MSHVLYVHHPIHAYGVIASKAAQESPNICIPYAVALISSQGGSRCQHSGKFLRRGESKVAKRYAAAKDVIPAFLPCSTFSVADIVGVEQRMPRLSALSLVHNIRLGKTQRHVHQFYFVSCMYGAETHTMRPRHTTPTGACVHTHRTDKACRCRRPRSSSSGWSSCPPGCLAPGP